MITLEAIAARYAELAEEQGRVNARFRKERESLAELCASLGHKFGGTYVVGTTGWGDDFSCERERHYCTLCGREEWVGELKRIPRAKYSDNVDGTVPDPVCVTGNGLGQAGIPCGVVGKGE